MNNSIRWIIHRLRSSVKLVPIKVADSSGKATILNTYLGIKKAIELGVDVVNISMNTASTTTSEILTEAINEAVNSGIFVVVSAGNLGLDTSKVSPANVDSAIVVSAVNSDNTFAGYSNYGNTIDYSAYGTYNGKTGTSYATARVSGIVADLLSKQGSLETLDKYAVDLGAEGKDPQFGKGLLTLETLQGSDEEDEADKIAKENKEKYEKLCANWKGMTDEELDSALEGLSETLRGFFLRELTESELADILGRDTLLVKPLNVTKAIIVDSVEDIPDTVEEPEVKSYDMAYKYYLELTEDLEISARVWTGNGAFSFNFSGSEDKSYNGTVKITLTNIDYNKSGPNANSSTKVESANISASKGVTGFELGTPYLIRQESSLTKWTGIYLVNMKFGVPQYHRVKSTNPTGTEAVYYSRFGFYYWQSDATGVDVTDEFGDIVDSNTTIPTYFQANAYNIGLDTEGLGKPYNAVMNVVFERPKYTVTYYRNQSSKDKTTYVHKTKIKYGATHKLIEVGTAGFTFAGHKFKEWAVDSASGTKKDPGDTITIKDNKKIYAKWNTNTYTVKYDLDGGSGSFPNQTKTYNVDLTLHSGKPTKTGSTFKHWLSSSDNKTYPAGGKYTKNANTTMKAIWATTKYPVVIESYRRNNTSSSWVKVHSVTKQIAYNATLDLSADITTGYNKANENKASGVACYNFSGATYKTTANVNANTGTWTTISNKKVVIPAGGITIHLNYTGSAVTQPPTATPIPSYNFTVNPNGGTMTIPDGSETTGTWTKKFTYGEDIYYFCTGQKYYAEAEYNACSLPIREGCTFAGWSVNPSSAIIDQHLFTPWWDYHTNYKGNVTVTAKWNTSVEYEYYKYDAGSDSWQQIDTPEEIETVMVGNKIQLTDVVAKANAKTPEGYEISKYTVGSVDGSSLESVSSSGAYTVNGATTICICYMPKDLNLTIDTKDGVYNTAAGQSKENLDLNFTYGVEKSFSSKDINSYVSGGMSLPVKKGYHLCDPDNEADVEYVNNHPSINSTQPWVIVSGTGEVIDGDTYSYDGMSTVDVTVEANWIPNIVDLYINPNGGVLYGYDYNTGVVKEWSSDIFTKKYEMGTKYQFTSTGGYTLGNNSSVLFASTHHGWGGADDKVLDKPFREGYTFNGWTSNRGGTISEERYDCIRNWYYENTSDDTSDIYLTAQWTPNKYNLTVDPNGGVAYAPDGTLFGGDNSNKTWSKEFTYNNWTYFCTGGVNFYNQANGACSLPTKEGYVFSGWEISPGGTIDQSHMFNNWWDFHGDYAGNVTIKAKWGKGYYPVVCEDRVGSASGTLLGTHTEDFAYGTTVSGAHWGMDTSLSAYYTGYYLSTWTTATVTTAGATVYRIFKKPGNMELNVNPNGGTWKGNTTTVSFTNKELGNTEDIPDPTISNYTAYFNGNGGTSDYSSKRTTRAFDEWDETYPKGASLSAGTFDRVNKIFTFGSNENGRTDLTATWKGSYLVKLPSAKWAGRDFIGWYTAPTGGTLVGIEGDYVTVKKDITYYAHWVAHPTKITLSNTVDKSKVCFAKGNPVAVFKVEGTDVMGDKHTFIKTLKWDTTSNNYQSLSFTILSGNYTVTLVNQNEYTVGTPSGTNNVSASGTTASVNMSDGSEATVNFTTSESDYSKYTGNSLVTTSLK